MIPTLGSSHFPTINLPLFLSSPLGFPCPGGVSALKVTLLWRENSLMHCCSPPPNLVLLKMRFEKPRAIQGPIESRVTGDGHSLSV